MISAIVLAPDGQDDDVERAREIIVRSLVWLVSAVVSGVVRDVTLAVPAGLGLSEVADQSGCGLVQEDDEAARLDASVRQSRGPRLLILKAGYQPDAGLAEAIDSFIRREADDAVALVVAAPETAAQRLFPYRAPVVGVLVNRDFCLKRRSKSFAALTRALRRGMRLRPRANRIV